MNTRRTTLVAPALLAAALGVAGCSGSVSEEGVNVDVSNPVEASVSVDVPNLEGGGGEGGGGEGGGGEGG